MGLPGTIADVQTLASMSGAKKILHESSWRHFRLRAAMGKTFQSLSEDHAAGLGEHTA